MHIAICELYHPQIHGTTELPPSDIEQHYIVHEILPVNEVMMGEHTETVREVNEFYHENAFSFGPHPTIRNFHTIASDSRYISLEIVQVSYYAGKDGLEWCVGCLKTVYIKLLQRRWRNILKQRSGYVNECKKQYAICCRETTGRFPFSPRTLPC